MGWRAITFLCFGLLLAGCTSVALVSPEYAARPVETLNQQAALTKINAFRTKHGVKPLKLDARLSRAAAAQSADQAGRRRISHYGKDGSRPKDRAARAGYAAKITAENVASGQKSFADAMYYWERSAGHRRNLLLPDVTAAGVAMAKAETGRAYWTLLLGAE